MSLDERQRHRMAEMRPVMDAYWDFLSGFSSGKDSNLQKAQTYSLYQRKQLEAVLAGWKTGTYEQCGGANR